jgi:hypothetical protein
MFNDDLETPQAIELDAWERRSLLFSFKEWTSGRLQGLCSRGRRQVEAQA